MYAAELQVWESIREHWLRAVLVTALMILNLADILTTQTMLARGGIELNPLSAWLIDNGSLVYAKVGVVSVIMVAAGAMASDRRLVTVLGPVVALYTVVVMSNSVQLLLAG